MGFDLLNKIRDLFALGGWNSSGKAAEARGAAAPVGAAAAGAASGAGGAKAIGTAAEQAAEAPSLSGRKRRKFDFSQGNEEAVRLIKYRRVDNTFPKFMLNDANDYSYVGMGKPTAADQRRSINTRSSSSQTGNSNSQQSNHIGYHQSQTRRSIFEAPQLTQTRVRNLGAVSVDVDLSDDEPVHEENNLFGVFGQQVGQGGNGGGAIAKPRRSSYAVKPQLLYSDAVRHGTNGGGYMQAPPPPPEQVYPRPSSSQSSSLAGFAESRLNGHGGSTSGGAGSSWYDTSNVENIMLHEDQRCDRSQYIHLINNLSLHDRQQPNQSQSQSQRRFNKRLSSAAPPPPPPVQRITQNGDDWLRGLISSKSADVLERERDQRPVAEHNSELAQYAQLINKEKREREREREREGRTAKQPAAPPLPLPPLERCDSSSLGSSSSSGSLRHNQSHNRQPAKQQQRPVTDIIELDDDEDDDVQEVKQSGTLAQSSNSSLVQTSALQRRFQSSAYFSDNFTASFAEKCARLRQESKHVKDMAWQEADKSTETRRAFEQELRESLSLRMFHRPIFVLENFAVADVKEVEFPPMTEEHVKRYQDIVHGPGHQVLVSKFSLNITRKDIGTLMGNNWLNDEVINFYMNLLTDRSERRSGKLPSVYAMNTFFVPRLLQNGHSAVKRWTRKVDLFSKDIIPVPVHVNGVHWCMAIIHMKNKTIRYYDSMGKPNPAVLAALELYLHDESLDKRKQPFDTSDFQIESVANVPYQTNGSDCGVFSCMFAEYITRNKPLTFTQDHMEYFRKKMALEICGGELWM